MRMFKRKHITRASSKFIKFWESNVFSNNNVWSFANPNAQSYVWRNRIFKDNITSDVF